MQPPQSAGLEQAHGSPGGTRSMLRGGWYRAWYSGRTAFGSQDHAGHTCFVCVAASMCQGSELGHRGPAIRGSVVMVLSSSRRTREMGSWCIPVLL